MKWFVALLLFFLTSPSLASSIYNDYSFEQGIVSKNITWEGKHLLVGDVKVEEGATLTLKPNTWIVFNNHDVNNLGLNPDLPELIIEGSLNRPKNPDSVKIFTVQDPEIARLLNTSNALTIQPEPFETKPLQNKLRGYRRQYAIGWAIMYGIAFLL